MGAHELTTHTYIHSLTQTHLIHLGEAALAEQAHQHVALVKQRLRVEAAALLVARALDGAACFLCATCDEGVCLEKAQRVWRRSPNGTRRFCALLLAAPLAHRARRASTHRMWRSFSCCRRSSSLASASSSRLIAARRI